MNAGEIIKKIRFEMYMDQDSFAKELGVSKQTISNWETGKRHPALKKIKILRELCIKNKMEMPSVESFLD